MKAIEYANQKIKLPDGSLVSVVIWLVPEPSAERPHGFKYRLNYCTASGATSVRYDNEKKAKEITNTFQMAPKNRTNFKI
jgi:hypothetical protein